MLLHYLSLLLAVEVDPLSHSSSTSFCRERPDIPSVTGSDKFSEVDDNESPFDVLDPASPLSLNDFCIFLLTTDYGVDVSVEPTPVKMLICLILSGGFQLFCTSIVFYKAMLMIRVENCLDINFPTIIM